MRFDRLAGLGGLDVPADEAVGSLERLGFALASRDAQSVTVHVPSWRNDVANFSPLEPSPSLSAERLAVVAAGRESIEPECDLIEEVLRLRSLDAVPPVSLPRDGAIPPASLTPKQTRAALARRMLAAQGLAECVTFSFMDSREAAVFGAADDGLMLANPIAADLDRMRPTPVATLLLAAKRNAARGFGDVGLFEIGPSFPDSAG
eukprot:gene67166-92015_t